MDNVSLRRAQIWIYLHGNSCKFGVICTSAARSLTIYPHLRTRVQRHVGWVLVLLLSAWPSMLLQRSHHSLLPMAAAVPSNWLGEAKRWDTDPIFLRRVNPGPPRRPSRPTQGSACTYGWMWWIPACSFTPFPLHPCAGPFPWLSFINQGRRLQPLLSSPLTFVISHSVIGGESKCFIKGFLPSSPLLSAMLMRRCGCGVSICSLFGH